MSTTLDKIISSEKERGYDRISNFLSTSIAESREAILFVFPDFDSILSTSILQLFLLEANVSFRVKFTPKIEVEEWRDWPPLIISSGINLPKATIEFLEGKKFRMLCFKHSVEDYISSKSPLYHEVCVDYSRTSIASVTLRVLREVWLPHSEAYLPVLIGALALKLDRSKEGGFTGLERELVEEAVSKKVVEESLGLKISSFEDKPVLYSLHDTLNPYIRGVTGDFEGSKKFLEEVGVKNYEGLRVTELPGDLMSTLVKSLLKRVGSSEKVNVGWLVGKVYRIPSLSFNVRDLKDITNLLMLMLERYGVEKLLISPLVLQKYISSYYELLRETPKKLRIAFEKSLKFEGLKSKVKPLVLEGLRVGEDPILLLRSALEDHGVIEDSSLIVVSDSGKYYVRLEDVKKSVSKPEVEWRIYDDMSLDVIRGYGSFSDLEVLEVKT